MTSFNKTAQVLGSIFMVGFSIIGISRWLNRDGLNVVNGETQGYTLTIDYTKGYLTGNTSDGYQSSSYGPINTTSGNPISFAFNRGMRNSDNFALGQLEASTGYFYNTTPITGIQSVVANYSSAASMTLSLGSTVNPSNNTTPIATGVALASTASFSFFKLAVSSKYAVLTSIVIQYSCTEDASSSSSSSSSSLSSSVSTTNQFALVTSTSDLTIGSSFLITYINGSTRVGAGVLSGGYLTPVTIPAPIGNIITLGNEAVSKFVLGGTSGAYTLTSAEGRLYSSAAKSVNFSNTGTGTWAITFTSSVPSLTNTTSTYGKIQYNSLSPRFTTYTTTQGAIALYKNDSSGNSSSSASSEVTLASIAITTPPSKTSYAIGENLDLTGLSVSATYSDTSTAVLASGNYTTNPANGATLSSSGSVTVTVSYTYLGVTKTATFTVSVGTGANYTTKTMVNDYQDYMDNNYYSNMDSMPTIGTVNLLVIPVQLSGYPMTEATRTRIQQAYFGTEAETGWHSVASFYQAESNGRLTITGVVSPIYSTSYGASITETQTTSLVTTATNWYKSTYSTNNGKEFDADSDGYIDGVILIYSAQDYSSSGGSNDNLWAYCYWTGVAKNTSSPVANTYFWASYDFMNESTHCTIDAHTYIHELGHVMGLDDYYNYDSTSSYGAAGAFNMQDYNVGEHDPYSRVALGWIDPIVATGSSTLTIAPGQAVILSPNDLSSSSPFDEYLILDVYSPTGLNAFDSTYKYGTMYPQGPSTTGIRVWHVDARLMKNYSGSGTPTLATTISSGNTYYHAMSNSTDSTYGSLYSGYRSYKLLHLLQCGGINTYKTGSQFSAADLWTVGKTFSMSAYASFFVNSGKMDSNVNLLYSFSVTAISGTNVTLSIVRS